jgi:DNA gyrase inhibitor GyrI
MNYKIENMPINRVAYMRRTGAYGAENYALMDRLKAWAGDKGLFNKSAVILGISQDNPQTTPPENCRYDVCIEVTDDYVIEGDGLNEMELPGGRYAVFTISHTAETVQKAWGEIFKRLSELGQQPDLSRPVLERYIQAMIDKELCEICVPV